MNKEKCIECGKVFYLKNIKMVGLSNDKRIRKCSSCFILHTIDIFMKEDNEIYLYINNKTMLKFNFKELDKIYEVYVSRYKTNMTFNEFESKICGPIVVNKL